MANLKALYNRVLLLFPAKLASHNYKADIAYEVDNQICVCGQAPATKPVMSLADTVQHANWLHTSVHALLEMKEALAYVKPVAVVDKPKQTAHAVQPAAVSASTSAEATQKPHVTPSASTFASSSSSISQAINAARQAIQSSSSSTQKLQVTPSTHHASSSSANIHQSRPGSSSQPSSSTTVARASGSQGNSTNYSVSKPVTTPLVSHATAAATPSAAAQNVQPNDADLDIPPAADELTIRKATPAEIDELLALIPGFDRSKAIAISGHHYDFIRDGPNDNEPVILADFNLSDELDDYQFDSWTDMSGTPRAFFYLAFANPMGKLQLQQSIELLDSAELSINDHALSIADLGEVEGEVVSVWIPHHLTVHRRPRSLRII